MRRVNLEGKETMPLPLLSKGLAEDSDLSALLLEHMVDVITIIDDTGLIVYQSKSIVRLLGHRAEAMLGREVTNYVHVEDVALVATAIDQLLSGALETNEAEFRFLHSNGEYRQMHGIARVWARNGVRGVIVNSRDVTGAYEDRKELAKQNELLEKTFMVSKNLLTISLPGSGVLLRVNDAWCETLGHQREDALGQTALSLGVWGASQNRERFLGEFERQGRLQNFESTCYTKDGAERLMVIDAQLLQVADQPQILMSCTDVTESRRIEEELRQSQKMDAIGQLTGGVAHDFNNLIGVTMGNAELLLDMVADRPRALQHAQQIVTAAERGAKLTHQLLAFSRRQKLVPEPVDLTQLLADAHSMLQTSVSENTVIDIRSEPDLWFCQVDPNHLEAAILNLALNAHDAMPDGGLLQFELSNHTAVEGKLSVISSAVAGELAPGEYVALAITDTGSGMDAQTRARAFEPFFTTKGYGLGTGLGLSMVFGFVEQSGGMLSLQSEAGAGTTLTLVLPRATARESCVSVGVSDALPPKRLVAEAPKTVLVVEDNDSLRAVLVRALVEMGYRVLDASGNNALQQLLANSAEIDLLLSDVILKEQKRGPEIAAEVLELFPDVAVLFMTGFSPDELLLGAEYPVLTKPFTLVELSEVVHNILWTDKKQSG